MSYTSAIYFDEVYLFVNYFSYYLHAFHFFCLLLQLIYILCKFKPHLNLHLKVKHESVLFDSIKDKDESINHLFDIIKCISFCWLKTKNF